MIFQRQSFTEVNNNVKYNILLGTTCIVIEYGSFGMNFECASWTEVIDHDEAFTNIIIIIIEKFQSHFLLLSFVVVIFCSLGFANLIAISKFQVSTPNKPND